MSALVKLVHCRTNRMVLVTLFVLLNSTVRSEDAERLTFFETRIRPVLVAECYSCHSGEAKEIEGGLRLDSRDSARAGGDSGPAVVPHDPAASLLLSAIEYRGLEMPPKRKLSAATVADFAAWIRDGAVDPRVSSETSPGPTPPKDLTEARRHWAFQPLQRPAFPSVRERAWPNTAVDHFVLAQLEQRGLKPSAPAAPATLVRRVYFDLAGVPPSPDTVQKFVGDPSLTAYEELVDRLLASPQYGERAAQHWLDVVRYAETEGFEYDRELPDIWRYRDYVVSRFAADTPYDQFLSEQLAGDELALAQASSASVELEMLRAAAGFHRLGAVRRNAGNQDVASSRNEVLTERTDIIGAAFLGLTIGCARCHDHKFDPISQRDYYRLQAYVAATEEDNVQLASEQDRLAWQNQTDRINAQITEYKQQIPKTGVEEAQKLRAMIVGLESSLPQHLPTICTISNRTEDVPPVFVLRRGNPGLPGEQVGMRTLSVLTDDAIPETPLRDDASPRTDLARWLTQDARSLTARVIANRVWQQHFGRAIVETPNDFGQNGAPPSHLSLLDYLADFLIRHDWQLKPLHRLILLSSVYRQSSSVTGLAEKQPGNDLLSAIDDNCDSTAEGDSENSYLAMHATQAEFRHAMSTDPANRWLWRFPRRRLSAEELRDAMLGVAGQLNNKMYGPSVVMPVDDTLVNQLYKPDQWRVTQPAAERNRRSIYLFAKRNLRLPFMEVFDQPTSQTSCARREQSTHAPQALELLNGTLSLELARAFAERLQDECDDDIERQIDRAFVLTASRPPTALERQLAAEFINDVSIVEFALAMFNLNAFLYVD